MMDHISFDWKWKSILLLSVTYITLCRLLRYRARDGIQSKYPYKTRQSFGVMTTQHAFEIQKILFGTEFPFTSEKALQFALFRTYGIPSISSLLLKTKQLSFKANAGKRYSDTDALISEFVLNPPASIRANSALSRTNYIHSIYKKQGLISNDDLLYTLSLFALEPAKWIKRYEWRELTELELCAFGTFWKSVGDAMEISYEALPPSYDGLAWLESIRTWSEAYEARYMVPHQNNKTVADETIALLLYDVPSAAHPIGRAAVSALMDTRLRKAMMFDDPPPWLCSVLEVTFKIRKYILKYASLPRPWMRRKVVDEPDKNGKLHQLYYVAEPWYVKDTFWNRWGPQAWMKWLLGNPIPSAAFRPEGYLIPEMGPKIAEGKGREEHDESLKHLIDQNRGGCPFQISL